MTSPPPPDEDLTCHAKHPDPATDLVCERTGIHEVHSAYNDGWLRWPNDEYVPPLNPKRDILRVAKRVRDSVKAESHPTET